MMAGPTPVSALIHAATMVNCRNFMITRLNFLFDLTPDVQSIAVVGAVTAFS
jgi:NADH-quinone oxidoreductase subunit L